MMLSVMIPPKRRYMFLFFSLMVLMVLAPFLQSDLARIFTDGVFLWVILSGIIAIQKHRRVVVLSLTLGAAAFFLFIWNHLSPMPRSFLIQEIVEILFLTILITSVLRHVLETRKVTLDTIYGASCVYLMLGLLWGSIYTLIEITSPGSFTESTAGEISRFSHLIYFSFVTLTTLGYGDISPVSGPASVFAMLEAIVGQLFLVIMVARLVSLQVSHSQQDD